MVSGRLLPRLQRTGRGASQNRQARSFLLALCRQMPRRFREPRVWKQTASALGHSKTVDFGRAHLGMVALYESARVKKGTRRYTLSSRSRMMSPAMDPGI